MSIPPDDLPGMIAYLVHEVAELKRRDRGRSRTGKIADVDEAKGLYRVKISDGDGAPFLSPWLPVEALASGALKIQGEPVMDQTVTIKSPSGEITDGVIALSSFNDDNPRPHDKGGEFKMTVGGTTVLARADDLTLQSNESGVVISGSGLASFGGTFTHNGANIGDTHIHGGVVPGSGDTDVPSN